MCHCFNNKSNSWVKVREREGGGGVEGGGGEVRRSGSDGGVLEDK